MTGTTPRGRAGRLLLVRHAQTVWHRENRYAGARTDPALTAAGERQTGELARAAVAEAVQVVVSSPLGRAVRTARPAAEAVGTGIELEPGLREADFGELEGRTRQEADPELVRRFVADPVAHPFPGAEPPGEAADRAVAALRAVVARHGDRTVLVVAHSTVLRLALCRLLGLPLRHYRRLFPRIENVALTEIALPADHAAPAALLALNRTVPTP
ncbi:histidine phosphatase family protein [Streptomyces sp. XM4011]|uniref:histidine phosphatase family protein n=1 Tax=Streptomyces sp. XM4011 TaxID=2929780 RepID=UPI001FF81292|nr:histidine phosphatase family protein [Streptomyces sp. XM4011]MCK1814391.1 histidine phosphatase family protein [Streptomyces sp. XM4011]